jgi:type II secretory pathway pseudopilin PulG
MLMQRFVRAFKQQRGDTIVEVLVSITVVSLILGSAFVTTNKSLQATRTSQERSNALKLAESQVEQLKGAVANPATAPTVFGAAGAFCMYTTAGAISVLTTPNANCTVGTGGAPTTVEPKFNLSITRSGNDFTIKNTWNNLNGKSVDQITIKYRVYQ